MKWSTPNPLEQLQAEHDRVLELITKDPDEFRLEVLREVRGKAALLARVLSLGASVSMNHVDFLLPGDWELDTQILEQLETIAKDVHARADWLVKEEDGRIDAEQQAQAAIRKAAQKSRAPRKAGGAA